MIKMIQHDDLKWLRRHEKRPGKHSFHINNGRGQIIKWNFLTAEEREAEKATKLKKILKFIPMHKNIFFKKKTF